MSIAWIVKVAIKWLPFVIAVNFLGLTSWQTLFITLAAFWADVCNDIFDSKEQKNET